MLAGIPAIVEFRIHTKHICVECGESPQGIYDYEEERLEVALDARDFMVHWLLTQVNPNWRE